MEKENGTITAKQFRNLQSAAGIKNAALAKILGKAGSTISAYRSGKLQAPLGVIEKMTVLAKKKRSKKNQDELEGRVAQWISIYASQLRGEEYAFSAAPKYRQVNINIEENLQLMTADSDASWWSNPQYGD